MCFRKCQVVEEYFKFECPLCWLTRFSSNTCNLIFSLSSHLSPAYAICCFYIHAFAIHFFLQSPPECQNNATRSPNLQLVPLNHHIAPVAIYNKSKLPVRCAAGGASDGRNPSDSPYGSQQQPQQRYSTVYRFEFGDRRGGGGGTGGGGGGGDDPDDPHRGSGGGFSGGTGGNPRRPRHSNLPDFLIPPQLITYETTLEINVRRIRAASPPPPPRFVKKLLVHNEQLERKTRAFLSDSFDAKSAESALRHARQKIRSAKMSFLSTDDDVRHAEDTVHKAKARDFLNIYNPRLGPDKPLYEFVEVPTSGECAESVKATASVAAAAAASTSGTTKPIGESAKLDEGQTMSEYTSSRFSSRSSRKSRVEGEYRSTICIDDRFAALDLYRTYVRSVRGGKRRIDIRVSSRQPLFDVVGVNSCGSS